MKLQTQFSVPTQTSKQTLIFDCETNGLYHDVSEIHCIAIWDSETKETHVFNDRGDNCRPITEACHWLGQADVIIGHNVIGYDLPVIRKIYPFFHTTAEIVDTLVLSRLYHPNMMEIDKKRAWERMPLQLYGRHSLESYGYRLGEYKGEFGKTSDWKQWSQEMQDYCVQDVQVTRKLCEHFRPLMTRVN